jgi:hypothetical protein
MELGTENTAAVGGSAGTGGKEAAAGSAGTGGKELAGGGMAGTGGMNKVSSAIIAVAFLLIITLMAAGTLQDATEPMADIARQAVSREMKGGFTGAIAEINLKFEDSIAQRSNFIDVFGLVQRAMGKHEVDNYALIKDEGGMLHLAGGSGVGQISDDAKEDRLPKYINNISALHRYVTDSGRGFLMVEAPSTDLGEGYTLFPPGVGSADNTNIDGLLAGAAERGVPFIDVRDLFEGLKPDELRYRTDHHWAMPLVFKAFAATRDRLNSDYGYGLDPDGVYTDIDNYEKIVYEGTFLGSAGIRVGKYYAGMDDFALYIPKFDTDLKLEEFKQGHKPAGEYSGSFREAFIDESSLEPDHMNKYQAYLKNGYVENFIENRKSDNDLKCLFISDSYGRPYAQYLSLLFRETVVIDASRTNRFTGNVKEYIDEQDPDVVICMSSGHSVWHKLKGF